MNRSDQALESEITTLLDNNGSRLATFVLSCIRAWNAPDNQCKNPEKLAAYEQGFRYGCDITRNAVQEHIEGAACEFPPHEGPVRPSPDFPYCPGINECDVYEARGGTCERCVYDK